VVFPFVDELFFLKGVFVIFIFGFEGLFLFNAHPFSCNFVKGHQ